LTSSLEAAADLASALSAALTAYIAARTVYIWYRYLSETAPPKGTASPLDALLSRRLKSNPPSAFPAKDLPIATILLVVAGFGAFGLYLTDVLLR
jgi:hypothetical protein